MPFPASSRRRFAVPALAAGLVLSAAGLAGAAHPTPRIALGRGGTVVGPTAPSPPLPRPPWSANLFVGDRSTFNRSVGGWAASRGAHLTHVPVPSQSGRGALAMTNLTSHIGQIYVASGHNAATLTNAVPGYRYAFSFWTRSTVAGQEVLGQLVFLDAQHRQVAAVEGLPEHAPANKWLHLTNTDGIATPTARYVFARAIARNTKPAETQFVDTAVLQRAVGGAKAVNGPLHTSGHTIVDATGRAVRLRGVVRMGLQGGPVESVPTAHDIGQAKAWGANVIRLALGEQKWPGLPQNSCHVDSSYPTKVDNAVNLITGMGMYVILDLHWNTIRQCGPASPQPMADCNVGACNANAFWTAVANRYKTNARVGFDLYNEPHHISESVWRNGGKVTWQGVTYTAAGMQSMYNAVRATGATNLVFVTGLAWGNQFPSGGPLAGTNIVYSVHSYTCPGQAPPRCSSPTPYDGATYLRGWVGPGTKFPVFVGEFGWPNPRGSQYAQSLINFAEAHSWGWTDFTWGTNGYSRFALLSVSGAGSTYEPQPGGMPALQAFPGG